jgi:LysR family transcriptional regulator, nitrogen assimilation regulatory protein
MNIPAVRLFLEVADAGSLNRVAARRQTAQSHISRQITEFESQCGARLFRRTGRGVELTEFGLRAAARLRAWLQESEQLIQELQSASGRVMGEVRLGVIPSAAHPLTTHLMQRLRAEHPDVRLSVVEAQGAELDAMLDSGAVDLAILFRFQKPSGGEEVALCRADTYLVSAPGDPLTASPTQGFSRLAGLPLVLPRRPSHWRNALDEAARSLGFTLEAVAEADSLTVQKELVARMRGVYSVLGPYTIAADLRAGRLQATRLVRPGLVRHVALALRRQGKSSPASRMVAQQVSALVESWGHRLTEP